MSKRVCDVKSMTFYICRDTNCKFKFFSREKPFFENGYFYLPDTSNDRLRLLRDVDPLGGYDVDEGELLKVELKAKATMIEKH